MSEKPTPESYGFDETRITAIESELERRFRYNRIKKEKDTEPLGCGAKFVISLIIAALLMTTVSLTFVGGAGVLQGDVGGLLCLVPFGIMTIFLIAALRALFTDKKNKKIKELEELEKAVMATDKEVVAYESFKSALTNWTRKQQDFWWEMDGHQFEKSLAVLLNKNGWKTTATRGSGDHGIDLDGSDPDGDRVLIQCKWQVQPCGEPIIRDLAGVISVEGGKGLVVCKSGFTQQAKDWANRAKIRLWDIKDVMRLVEKTEF